MPSQGLLIGIALFSAVTGAAAYILYGPSPSKPRRRKFGPPGLVNIGNSCFVNALLQALAPCSSICRWLQSNASGGDERSLVNSTLRMLKALNNESNEVNDVLTASSIFNSLQAHRWVISSEEQDAHEMFHVLTATIEEELKTSVQIPSLNVNNNNISSSKDCISGILSRYCKSLPTVKQTIINLPFKGLQASQLLCESCSYKSPMTFDTFDSLSLAVPPRMVELRLQDCLRHYLGAERVKEVNCDNCNRLDENNKIKSNSIKQLTIGKIPDMLCIHIQRMVYLRAGVVGKRHDHVIFPLLLNMNEFRIGSTARHATALKVSGVAKKTNIDLVGGSSHEFATKPTQPNLNHWSNNNPLIYRLQSVIVHQGNVYSGHFVTYRRGPQRSGATEQWFECNDADIKPFPVDKVLQSCAYMLFYEKVRPNG